MLLFGVALALIIAVDASGGARARAGGWRSHEPDAGVRHWRSAVPMGGHGGVFAIGLRPARAVSPRTRRRGAGRPCSPRRSVPGRSTSWSRDYVRPADREAQDLRHLRPGARTELHRRAGLPHHVVGGISVRAVVRHAASPARSLLPIQWLSAWAHRSRSILRLAGRAIPVTQLLDRTSWTTRAGHLLVGPGWLGCTRSSRLSAGAGSSWRCNASDSTACWCACRRSIPMHGGRTYAKPALPTKWFGRSHRQIVRR